MYCSLFCVWPPAWAYCRSSAKNRLRPVASCLTAAWVQPLAASRTWSAGSAANSAEAIRRRSAAVDFMSVLSGFPEPVNQIGLAAHVREAEIAAQIRVRELGMVESQKGENAGVEIVQVNLVV